MRVADLGCGRTGQFIFPASKIVGEKGIVYAVDIIKDVLEDIKKRIQSEAFMNIQTVWSDVERVGKTPIPEHSLNTTILTNVIFLVKDKLSVLREAARLTAEHGQVIVIDWSKQLGPLGPSADLLVRAEDIVGLAKDADLTLAERIDLSDNHYCLIFNK